MGKSSVCYFSLIFILLTTSSCYHSRTEIYIQDFVEAYNKQNKYLNHSVIYSSSAESVYNRNTIRLKVITNYTISYVREKKIESLLKSLMANYIDNGVDSKNLLEKGLKFEVVLLSLKETEIETFLVNKDNIGDYKEQGQGHLSY